MYPVFFEIGPLTIFSLWLFIAIGLLIALLVIYKLTKKNRLKLEILTEMSMPLFLIALVVSRLVYIIKNYELFFQNFNFEKIIHFLIIGDKGLSVWGGIGGLIVTLLYLCHRKKEQFLRWLDIITVGILSALIFGNIGAFLDGTNYGNPTDLPWGITLENSVYTVPIHPVQIYAAIYCTLLTIILYMLFNTKFNKKAGNISILAMISYGSLRFLEEFFRGDEINLILGLFREAQIYALLGVIIGCILFHVRKKTL